MIHNRPLAWQDSPVPLTMLKSYRLEGTTADGQTIVLYEAENNYHRRNLIELDAEVTALRLIPLTTWGAEDAHIFSFDAAEKV